MNGGDRRRGKRPLSEAEYGVDLSGKDFEDIVLEEPQTLSHSFLNGVSISGSVFLGAPIDQTELAEAVIIGSYFRGTDFTGSSFIGARLEDVTFENCNFTDGEWRQSKFRGVKFNNCNFDYTTVNLCDFDECEFTGADTKLLGSRSVNYNVFTRTQFSFAVDDDVSLASNFGFPAGGTRRALVNSGAGTSLEEVCLSRASGDMRIVELADAIENEFIRTRQPRLKKLRLEFISNIITGLVRSQEISPTSLAYIESLFVTLAKNAHNESEALAAMSAVLNIRSHLFTLTQQDIQPPHDSDALCAGLLITYKDTYARADADHLCHMLGELACSDSDAFQITEFATGSTLISFVTASVVEVGLVFCALKFALRQGNIVLEEAEKMAKAIIRIAREVRGAGAKKRAHPQARVPALRPAGAVTREASLIQKAVAHHGRHAVELDAKADVVIYYVSNK
jgi:hypothetical protein